MDTWDSDDSEYKRLSDGVMLLRWGPKGRQEAQDTYGANADDALKQIVRFVDGWTDQKLSIEKWEKTCFLWKNLPVGALQFTGSKGCYLKIEIRGQGFEICSCHLPGH